MTVQTSEPAVQTTETERGPARHLIRWLLVALVAVVIAATITVLSQKPDLGPGSSYASTPGVRVASDSYSDTKFVVDAAAGGVLHVSVRNDSRIPVTIVGLDRDPATLTYLSKIQFEPNPDAPGKVVRSAQPPALHVTLGKGQEAGVLLTLTMPSCMPTLKGNNYIYTFIPVKVRRLGIARSTRIALVLPLWVHTSADHQPAAGCPGSD